jgi:glutaconate CoA-transferase subunit B
VRFSGSGGACDVASFVGRTIIFMQHEKRKFVRQVDYLTSPGWIDGPGRREETGLSPGGPAAVITNLAVMGFDGHTREMFLQGCYPGVSPEQILENMSFEVDISRSRDVAPPSEAELHILREICDPQRLILG